MSLSYNIRRSFDAVADKVGAASEKYSELNRQSEGMITFLSGIALAVASFNVVTKEEPVVLKPVPYETTAAVADPAEASINEARAYITDIVGLQKKLNQARIDFELIPPSDKPTPEIEAALKTIDDLNNQIYRQSRQFELLIYTSPQISEKASADLAKEYTFMTNRKASFYSDNYAITSASFNYKNECLQGIVSGSDSSTENIVSNIDRCTRNQQDRWERNNGYSLEQGLLDTFQAIALGGVSTVVLTGLAGVNGAAYRRRKQQKPN